MLVLDANDREVIEACQRGDSDAFRVLFEAHKDRVYSIALRYSGDPAAAMDIAQESFLKVLGSIQEFRGEAGFESWLYRIVVNTCLDYQRRGRRLMPCLGELIEAVSAHSETVLHRLMRAEVEDDVQTDRRRVIAGTAHGGGFAVYGGAVVMTRLRGFWDVRPGRWRRG